MSLTQQRISGIVIIGAGALALVVWLLWPRPVIARVEIISSNTTCPEVVVRGQEPTSFLRQGFRSQLKSLGFTQPEEARFTEDITRYLAASVAGCEDEVLNFRESSGFDERTMAVAQRAAVALPAEHRPDPGVLNSDAETALWFLARAEPWAWIDASSFRLAPRSWEEYRREFDDYYDAWLQRRKESIALAGTPYSSLFATATIPEPERESARLVRASLTFGLREGGYTVAPSLHLTIYFFVEDDGTPQVLSIFLDGNHSALLQHLAL